MLVAVLVVGGAIALVPTTTHAQQAIITVSDIQYAATVKLGSSGQAALIWQRFLNGYSTTAQLVEDGKFGPLSTTQAKAWQSNRGLVADGVLGTMSRAAAMAQIASNTPASAFPVGCTSNTGYSATTGLPCAGATYPAGCSSNTGYSATTGLPCTGTYNYPAGCSSATGYSTTTGLPCSGAVVTVLPAGCLVGSIYSSTTGLPCTGTVVSSTGEGSLAVTYDAIPSNNLAVNRGDSTAVMAIKLKATGSNMTVSRVWLNINTRIWLSATTVDLLDGGTVIATLPLSASTVTELTAGSSYQLQFNGLNVVVPNGTTKVLTFRVTRPTLTTADASVTITGATSSVRAVDMAGISNTYPLPSDRIWNMADVAASTGTMTTALSATSPASQSISGLSITTGALTAVKLADFNFKGADSAINITQVVATISSTKPGTIVVAEGTAVTGTGTTFLSTFVVGDIIKDSGNNTATISAIASNTGLTVTALSGTLVTGTGAYTSTTAVGNKVASAELRDGTNVLSSVALVAGVATFPALNIDVAKDTTKVLSVWAQVNPIGLAVNTTAKGSDLKATLNASLTVASDSGYATVTVSSADAAGSAQYMFQYAPTITLGTMTATPSNNGGAISGDFSIAFTVTAPTGSDIYVDKTVAISGADMVALSNSGTASDVLTVSSSTGGTDSTYGYIVLAGQSRTFTVNGHVPNGTPAYTSFSITAIPWATLFADTNATDINQTWGLINPDFKTASIYLTA